MIGISLGSLPFHVSLSSYHQIKTLDVYIHISKHVGQDFCSQWLLCIVQGHPWRYPATRETT